MLEESPRPAEFNELVLVAEAAASKGDWAAAAVAYERLVKSSASEASQRYELALVYEQLGRLRDAAELLSDPLVIGYKKAKQKLASILINQKKFKKAAPLVAELIAASPGNPKFAAWKDLCDRSIPLEDGLQEGQALIESGRLDDAERLYVRLAAEFPEAGRVFLHLGNIYNLQKRWADAAQSFRAGAAIDPNSTKLRTSLARALLKNGEVAEALTLLQRNSEHLDPSSLFLLQQCHLKLCNWPAVAEVSARLLELLPPADPKRVAVSAIREDALVQTETAEVNQAAERGDRKPIIQSLRDVVNRHPNSALAWVQLAAALADAQESKEAAQAVRAAMDLQPADSKVRASLTDLIIRTWDHDDILRHVQDSISSGTVEFESLLWLAKLHYSNYEWSDALDIADRALAMRPHHGSALFLKARALLRLNRLAEALDQLNLLLSVDPRRPAALQIKADIFVRLARIDDAISLYREASEKFPNHSLIKHRLSSALLLKGDIAGFNALNESRRKLTTFKDNNKEYPFLDWEGQLDLEGKLLVWSEFGLGVGQNILHMTFLKPLVSLGLEVVFEVEPRLVDLCRRSFPDITVVANDAEYPAGISHHTPIASLGRWFKPSLESFASMRPYFLPDAQAVEALRGKLQDAAGAGQVLVGISWTSNNPFVGDVKSVQLDQLLDALALPGVTLVNLQYGDHSDAIRAAVEKTGKRLMDSGIDTSNDLDGLAAVVAALDLVVCIGHTTAHIAGAVGTPNFVLLPSAPFAHWLGQGSRCIWYPASRLFRQAPVDQNWGPVLDEVSAAVAEFVSDYRPASWLESTLLPRLQPLSGRAGQMSSRELLEAVECFIAQGAYRSVLELIDRLPPDQLTRELRLKRSEMLANIGDLEEALASYVSLRHDEELDGELEKQILATILDMYDLENALPVAIRLADKEPSYRQLAAHILYRLGRYEEALDALRTLSIELPQANGLSTLVGTVLLEMGDVERAQMYLADQAALTHLPQDYSLLGRALSALGRHEDALTAFEKGLAAKKYHPSVNFWRTQERISQGLTSLVPLAPMLDQIPIFAPSDTVVFFAADSAYFWEHGLVLIDSIARNSPAVKCHVHLINPDATIPEAIDVIRRLNPELKLSYSYEYAHFEGCDANYIRAYYASIRFVRLAEVFARSPATYLCVDADCIVRADVLADGSISEVESVAIYKRFDERPNLSVAAGALVLRPTAAAGGLIDQVSSLIRSALESREAVWFLDQIVLSHVVRQLENEPGRVSQLDRRYIDWFFSDNGVIWTGKGKRKSEDARYTREVSRYDQLQTNEDISRVVQQDSEAS